MPVNPDNSQAYFSISNLKKSWNNPPFSLVFNAEIEKGKTLGILGKSGSGKSTVLQIASGLMKADKIEKNEEELKIMLEGKDISRLAPAKRQIGMVFQTSALFPHLTVLDNVAYGLRFSGEGKKISKKEAREIAFEFLKDFEMQEYHSRYPEGLSGGEAQRVSLARTLILKPKVIFFDEPFSALDKPIRKKLISDIINMQKKTSFTALFVSHDIEEARLLCSKITVLNKGKQTWTGNAEDFKEEMLEVKSI